MSSIPTLPSPQTPLAAGSAVSVPSLSSLSAADGEELSADPLLEIFSGPVTGASILSALARTRFSAAKAADLVARRIALQSNAVAAAAAGTAPVALIPQPSGADVGIALVVGTDVVLSPAGGEPSLPEPVRYRLLTGPEAPAAPSSLLSAADSVGPSRSLPGAAALISRRASAALVPPPEPLWVDRTVGQLYKLAMWHLNGPDASSSPVNGASLLPDRSLPRAAALISRRAPAASAGSILSLTGARDSYIDVWTVGLSRDRYTSVPNNSSLKAALDKHIKDFLSSKGYIIYLTIFKVCLTDPNQTSDQTIFSDAARRVRALVWSEYQISVVVDLGSARPSFNLGKGYINSLGLDPDRGFSAYGLMQAFIREYALWRAVELRRSLQ